LEAVILFINPVKPFWQSLGRWQGDSLLLISSRKHRNFWQARPL
jgi:hypothetical protein